MQVAKELGPGHRVACIAPDSAARYLSTEMFDGDGEGVGGTS
jgi:cysteine synthase A